MSIGLGIVLLVLGLILVTGAINLPDGLETAIVNPEALGWIFIIAAVIAVGLGLFTSRQSNRTTHVEERRFDR